MNVLHVTQGYWPAIGGTELLMQRVSEELQHRHGDRVTVFTTDCYNGEAFFSHWLPRLTPGWEEVNGVPVRRFHVLSRVSNLVRRVQHVPYRLRIPLNGYLRALSGGPIIPGLRRAIRQHPSDVVAASSFPLLHMFAALHGAGDAGRPCVLHGGLHPEDKWGFQRGMIYRAIRKAYYIANTPYEAEFVIARGANPDRVFVIGVGVDPEHYNTVSQEEAKRRLGFDDGPVIGFVGQIGGHKGVDALVKAMPRVWDFDPRAQLLIAGGRTNAFPDIERLVAGLPPERKARVVMRPDFPVEDKGTLFAAIDVFAYPSGYESFGIAFLEAWIAGKPVIGCRRGAIPTVINEWKDGLLVLYDDPGALALAIIFLLKDPAAREAFGAAGREKVLARFTWPRIADRFREVYALAVEKGPL